MKSKTIYMSLILGCFFLCASQLQAASSRKPKYDSLSCLEIEGKIVNAAENSSDCLVELIGTNNRPIDSLRLKEGKISFKFVLNRNTYYAIRISKKGFIPRLVCVNTKMQDAMEEIFRFEFQTSLTSVCLSKTLNKDAIGFPIAIIYFDEALHCFTYSKDYTAKIKKEMSSTSDHLSQHIISRNISADGK